MSDAPPPGPPWWASAEWVAYWVAVGSALVGAIGRMSRRRRRRVKVEPFALAWLGAWARRRARRALLTAARGFRDRRTG
jgi:hypothetical protein